MATSRPIPRILQLDIAKQWIQNRTKWSPRELLGKFPQSHSLTVKQSSATRFFMYEEHASSKLKDDNVTQVIQCSPNELANLLHTIQDHHYYWTSPIVDVAPSVLEDVPNYESIHPESNPQLLDPRGPSIWMGTPGSVTQAHYDVADNVLVQLYGTKRIRCYPPTAATALHVFPDAHPRARKSQVNFDQPNSNQHPHFENLPQPQLDVTLQPGDAVSIPAFWFHHVENGYPNEDNPTVSLNVFALSRSMMVAQQAFQQASQVLVVHPSPIAVLKELSEVLFRQLGRTDLPKFVRTKVLETRFVPLGHAIEGGDPSLEGLSRDEQQQIENCMAHVAPLLQSLDDEGVLELVLAHLLELWAVERAGANQVATTWDQVLATMEKN